jgi:cell division protein FtsZ
MSEMGMAMMGSALASGVDRARVAAEQAVASPLLDDITLDGARGVLVNISTAPGCLKMKEYHEVMGIIRQYADPDAQVKFGTAEVEDMEEDEIRVTLIATGLTARKPTREDRPDIRVVRTGTDNSPLEPLSGLAELDRQPAVMRRARRPATSVEPVDFTKPEISESYDIPAFLRKQAD